MALRAAHPLLLKRPRSSSVGIHELQKTTTRSAWMLTTTSSRLPRRLVCCASSAPRILDYRHHAAATATTAGGENYLHSRRRYHYQRQDHTIVHWHSRKQPHHIIMQQPSSFGQCPLLHSTHRSLASQSSQCYQNSQSGTSPTSIRTFATPTNDSNKEDDESDNRRLPNKSKKKKQRIISSGNHQSIYALLELSEFTPSEMEERFRRIVDAGEKKRANYNNFDQQHVHIIDSDRDTNIKIEPRDEEVVTVNDLEAYLLQRYQQIENQWKKNTTNAKKWSNNNNEYATTKTKTDKESEEAFHQSSTIIEQRRMQQCAKEDASTIFQLLLQHAPPQQPSSSTTTNNNNYTTVLPTSTPTTTTTLTKHQFLTSLTSISTTIHHPTILPLATSMLLVGSSVGVISPIMPFVASSLQLSTTQYGMVISSFAFMKMMGNVPSAIVVEWHGRKPYLVYSLCVVGMGVMGMGVASDWMQLCVCRMTVGLGVAALTTASTLTVADVSTPLSRASTFSPLMSAFAAGMALGPAIGGILHDAYGIRDTFFLVGLSYGVAAVWNHVSVRETQRRGEWWDVPVVNDEKKRNGIENGMEHDGGAVNNDFVRTLPWHDETTTTATTHSEEGRHASSVSTASEREKGSLARTISHAIRDTTQQWTTLLSDPKVQPVVIMNGFYMLALSGTQFTLLPLLLTGGGGGAAAASAAAATSGTVVASGAAGLALTASAVGQLYMWMSAVQVLGNPAAGRFADRMGKSHAIVAGGALTSLAMASVPVICAYGMVGVVAAADPSSAVEAVTAENVNWPLLWGTLGVWSLGGTLLATSHVAAISDVVQDTRRSQAIALLRTAGDVGYLCGAVGAGLAADLAGDVGLAMQAGSAVLMGSTVWFGLKTLALPSLMDEKEGCNKQ